MVKKADVSVIIPCYRCTDTIERAVNSIAEQTLLPAEVILVDDCSGDNTLALLYRIQANYPQGWVHVIALPRNAGPGTVRNVGWEAATQPYIAFLDSDDSWHKQKIEIQYGWMQQHPEVAMTGHACKQVGDKIVLSTEEDLLADEPGFYEVVKIKLLLSNRFPTRSVMLRNDVPYRFPAGKRYIEDYHLWTEICCNGLKCYRSDFPLAFLYKATYGEKGLSASLWKMEKGELDTYRSLFKQGHIGYIQQSGLFAWSLMRFLKRIAWTLIFRSWN